MKKCASCTKDLPDAALHCVFCGAKQAAAPAQPPGLQKTVMGYSSTEMIAQLKAQGGAQPQPPRPQPMPPPSAQMPAARPPMPMQPPPSAQMPAAPRPHPASQPPPGSAQVPSVGVNAATMFVPGGGALPGAAPARAPNQAAPMSGPAPMNAYAAPSGMQPTMVPPSAQMGMPPTIAPPSAPMGMPPPAPMGMPPPAGMGLHAPNALTPPPGPLPGAPQPYQAQPRAVGGIHPVEPWKDSLRLWMFVWGALTLAAFATPMSTDPLVFGWDAIIHGKGTAQLLALLVPAIGLLSIVVASVPMPAVSRGVIAAVLGLTGILLPWFLVAIPEWQPILLVVGTLTLVPGLLARHEYREALLPRLLVTIGVIATLAPLLIPEHGEIPLVALVKGLIDFPGALKILPIVGGPLPTGGVVPGLALVVVVVMCLLAWMPAPATGGGNAFAWIIIVWPVVSLLALMLATGAIGDVITKTPGVLMAWAPGSAYIVLVGFGVATVAGKQLE